MMQLELQRSPEVHDAAAEQLGRDGFTIIENAIDTDLLGRINAELQPHFAASPFGTGHFYGHHTKRFGQLLNRSRLSEALILHPEIMRLVESCLSPHATCLQLNLTQGIEIHPGAPAQVPHRDQDMWGGPKGEVEYMVNVMWALTDFTADNGATRIWRGSNHGDRDEMLPDKDAIFAEMPAGSACLFLGSTLHSGGANRTRHARRGIIISYCLGWLRPWENQWLVYPPEVARDFSPELAAIVGYQQHLPSLGNVEGHCPSLLLQPDPPKPFVDALRPDQQQMMEEYNAIQFANWEIGDE